MENLISGFLFLGNSFLFILLAMAVLSIIGCWKLYQKAGEPGWASIVPFYNTYKMSMIATGKATAGWASIVLTLLRFVSNAVLGSKSELSFVLSLAIIVVDCYLYYVFTESFGQPTKMCVLSILFGGIIFMIIACDKNTCYVGSNNRSTPKFARNNSIYGGGEYQGTYDYSSYHNNNNEGFLK